MTVLKTLLIILLIYFVSWTVLYSVVMEGDYKFFFTYFIYSFSGGGEIPSLIQMASISLSFFITIFIFLIQFVRKRKNKKGDAHKPEFVNRP